jgi:hypothetical protein
MPAWPAVCNAVRRSQCTVKVAVGLRRAACDPHLICGLMITGSKLQMVQANGYICMSASACKELLLKFFYRDRAKLYCAGTSTLVST